jgi:hypothetical protein
VFRGRFAEIPPTVRAEGATTASSNVSETAVAGCRPAFAGRLRDDQITVSAYVAQAANPSGSGGGGQGGST